MNEKIYIFELLEKYQLPISLGIANVALKGIKSEALKAGIQIGSDICNFNMKLKIILFKTC